MCINTFIDGGANNYDLIDLSDTLHRNMIIDVFNKISFERR